MSSKAASKGASGNGQRSRDLSWQPTNPTDVGLFISPWVQGTRAEAYFGPIKVDFWALSNEKSWETFLKDAILDMQAKAFGLGANAVVGTEIYIDPWAPHPDFGVKGHKVEILGTAARLVPLY